MTTDITIRREDHVDVITIDRPDVRNALRFQTYDELETAVRDTTARCLVITGTDPAFCSGDDVKQIMVGAGEAVASGLRRAPALTPAAEALLYTDVPVVAAVNGAAVGWGMELALMADIRVASERAKLGELFVHRNVANVVEIPARVRVSGFEPLTQTPLAPEILGLIQHVAAYERLAAEAAVTRDAVVAHKALLTHPLIGQDALAEQLLDGLLAQKVMR